jgi:raffinose/stachyose/melibiose transport system substrate-binding protein
VKTLRTLAIAVAVAATALLAAGTAGAASGHRTGSNLGSSYDASSAGKSTLTIWWLGNQEIPGIEAWMKDTISAYEKLHPNVTVKTVLESTDTYTTTQKTACKGGSGPDIWYNWGGTWSLEQVWAGCVVPNEDALSPTDLSNVPAIAGTRWQNKTWVYPIETRVYPIVYNKALFKKAGLDPNKPPLTWTTLVADAKKIKAAGITPFVTGLKDGFGGENLAVAMQSQDYSVGDLLKMVTSGTFTDPLWTSWLQKIAELKPYFNVDTNSIPYAEGLARFQSGKAAMVFASPGFQQTIIAMSKAGKGVGIMKVPTFGKYGGILYEDTPGFQVLKFAKNKALAGNFLAFMHTQAEMKSLYADTGDLPNDKRWNTAQVTRPTDKLLVKWIKQKLLYYSANYYPTQLDVNGNFVALQGILGGNYTPAKAAELYQNVISKWRKINSGEINNYKIWEKSNP